MAHRRPSSLIGVCYVGSEHPNTGTEHLAEDPLRETSGEVLGDDVMAAALIDRVLHHCHLVNIRGNSYRMREHSALRQALLQPDAEAPTDTIKQSRRSKAATGH